MLDDVRIDSEVPVFCDRAASSAKFDKTVAIRERLLTLAASSKHNQDRYRQSLHIADASPG
ncbi:hypothetical protein [Sphingomonas sp. 67-41]|uniref:hypothetical protein n=1 Tax=Sphingomonas TaxID=13687 RepID=UPI00257A85A1|nr:hypothetical protein [Sphingomonas sp. 67-41]